MVLNFVSGTAEQRAVVEETIARQRFPFDRLDEVTINVEWVVDPTPTMKDEFAWTEWSSTPVGACSQKPSLASIRFKDDLLDPGRADGGRDQWPKGFYAGRSFVRDVVEHELGHVVQSQLTPAQITRICEDVFGVPASRWANPDDDWEDHVQEGFAETFKDVFLERGDSGRKFDNRTNFEWPQSKFDIFWEVLDAICPCLTPGGGDGGGDS